VGYGRPAAETVSTTPPAAQPRDTGAVATRSYHLEDELPERTPSRPAQLVERITPVAADTFDVQDMAVEEAPKQLYAVGYRIQVFASADRAAAEAMKQRVVAQSRMNTYIEYEDGLYKVRAGDFGERKDALQAKLSLEKAFPGCWVVRTTVRTE
jgi:cell division septation protein DedD